jgi:hypothetical protein
LNLTFFCECIRFHIFLLKENRSFRIFAMIVS